MIPVWDVIKPELIVFNEGMRCSAARCFSTRKESAGRLVDAFQTLDACAYSIPFRFVGNEGIPFVYERGGVFPPLICAL